MTGDGWEHSTEGDLDPDLTEEAGYGRWEAPRRSWTPIVLRAGTMLLLAAIVMSVLAVTLR